MSFLKLGCPSYSLRNFILLGSISFLTPKAFAQYSQTPATRFFIESKSGFIGWSGLESSGTH